MQSEVILSSPLTLRPARYPNFVVIWGMASSSRDIIQPATTPKPDRMPMCIITGLGKKLVKKHPLCPRFPSHLCPQVSRAATSPSQSPRAVREAQLYSAVSPRVADSGTAANAQCLYSADLMLCEATCSKAITRWDAGDVLACLSAL